MGIQKNKHLRFLTFVGFTDQSCLILTKSFINRYFIHVRPWSVSLVYDQYLTPSQDGLGPSHKTRYKIIVLTDMTTPTDSNGPNKSHLQFPALRPKSRRPQLKIETPNSRHFGTRLRIKTERNQRRNICGP